MRSKKQNESTSRAADVSAAETTHLKLTPANFARLLQRLEQPAKVIPALSRLLSKQSVLDR